MWARCGESASAAHSQDILNLSHSSDPCERAYLAGKDVERRNDAQGKVDLRAHAHPGRAQGITLAIASDVVECVLDGIRDMSKVGRQASASRHAVANLSGEVGELEKQLLQGGFAALRENARPAL